MSQLLKIIYEGDFKILEVTYENGETYILDGECSNCGQCCLDPNNNVGYNDENGKCVKLLEETIDDVKKYFCMIHSTRPISCMLWPTSQDEIDRYPNCTLKFRKKFD